MHTKLLDVENNSIETAQTVAHYVHGSLENKDLNIFSGNKCSTMFGVAACSFTGYVSAKLKGSVKDKLIGALCPAHILNNSLQHVMETLGVQSGVLKIYDNCENLIIERLMQYCGY